jgi:hypothetical protein
VIGDHFKFGSALEVATPYLQSMGYCKEFLLPNRRIEFSRSVLTSTIRFNTERGQDVPKVRKFTAIKTALAKAQVELVLRNQSRTRARWCKCSPGFLENTGTP